MGIALGIDFSWIFVDFGSQVGGKLGSKIDKKTIQKGIEKQMARRKRLGSVLERFGPKIWKTVGPNKGRARAAPK